MLISQVILKEPVETIDIKHTDYGFEIKNLSDSIIDNINVNFTKYNTNKSITSKEIKNINCSTLNSEDCFTIRLFVEKIDNLIVNEKCKVYLDSRDNTEINTIKNYGIIRHIYLDIDKLDIDNSILYTEDLKKQNKDQYIHNYFITNKKGDILFLKNKEYFELINKVSNYKYCYRTEEEFHNPYSRYINGLIGEIEFYNKKETTPLIEYLKHKAIVNLRYYRWILSKRYVNPIETINNFLNK